MNLFEKSEKPVRVSDKKIIVRQVKSRKALVKFRNQTENEVRINQTAFSTKLSWGHTRFTEYVG